MKLHLTASSERGKPVTKSGNDYLLLEVKDDNRETIATVRFDVKKDEIGELITCQVWSAERVYNLSKLIKT